MSTLNIVMIHIYIYIYALSVLPARHDGDDDIYAYVCVSVYVSKFTQPPLPQARCDTRSNPRRLTLV